MTKTHRMFNHHKHGDGKKLALMLENIQNQTAHIHDVLAVVGAPGVAIDSAQVEDVLKGAVLLVSDITKIQTAAVALANQVEKLLPPPTPAPSPTPTPAPTTGGSGGALPPAPADAPTSWPSFEGAQPTFVGTSSSNVSVYYDAALGPAADLNASDLLADTDRIVGLNNAIFGRDLRKPSPPVNVLLFAMGATDGTGGADHLGCTFKDGGNIEVCVSYGDSARCSGLFEAELSECAMNGVLCGKSTGEALSRWCAAVVSNDALADFATAPGWADNGMVNWVAHTEDTDQNPESIGCGMAFISYLLHRGATLPVIAQMMVRLGDDGTFADLYASLKMGTASLAWPTFISAVRASIHAGGAIRTDDPFGQVTMAMTKDHPHV